MGFLSPNGLLYYPHEGWDPTANILVFHGCVFGGVVLYNYLTDIVVFAVPGSGLHRDNQRRKRVLSSTPKSKWTCIVSPYVILLHHHGITLVSDSVAFRPRCRGDLSLSAPASFFFLREADLTKAFSVRAQIRGMMEGCSSGLLSGGEA